MAQTNTHPKLRAVEVFPVDQNGERLIVVNDPSGMAVGPITVTPPGLFLLSLFDGQHNLEEIGQAFTKQFGQELPAADLQSMISQLDAVRYLEGDTFATHLQSLIDAYRAAPAREGREEETYAVEGEGLRATIARMLAGCEVSLTGSPNRRLAGLIAPHLDYGRGKPCYADAYGALAGMGPAERFVILGTNHFGRATSVVATRKDFKTPLGLTRTDRTFLEALEARCGASLCEHEFDHLREHSVELQVLILQYLFGADKFEIVPVLCHDPCGPNGTAPYDGNGVDLEVFANALGELIREDSRRTVIIAGADLSHVGRRFGDDRELEEGFLREVQHHDREALDCVVTGLQTSFLKGLVGRANSTRVCSAGCIYTLMTALPGSHPELLRYHQAVDVPSGTCVTCSAVAFWDS